MKKKILSALLIICMLACSSGVVYAADVTAVQIITYPDRTIYLAGEIFDPTGLTVRVNYKNGSSVTISSADFAQLKKYTVKSGDTAVFYIIEGVTLMVPIKTMKKSEQEDVNRNNISIYTKTHMAFISGYEDGTFRPNKTLTRAEAIAMLCRIVPNPPSATSKSSSYETPFEDVTAEAWYYPYVGYLYKNGVIAGDEGDYFSPDKPITRAEFAVYISRFKKYTASKKQVFSDVPTSYWAAEEIAAVYENGWIKGYTDGTFKPEGSLTRAEATATLNRMMGREINKDSIIGMSIRYFSDVPQTHWAYYSIVEASTKHSYKIDSKTKLEVWKQ